MHISAAIILLQVEILQALSADDIQVIVTQTRMKGIAAHVSIADHLGLSSVITRLEQFCQRICKLTGGIALLVLYALQGSVLAKLDWGSIKSTTFDMLLHGKFHAQPIGMMLLLSINDENVVNMYQLHGICVDDDTGYDEAILMPMEMDDSSPNCSQAFDALKPFLETHSQPSNSLQSPQGVIAAFIMKEPAAYLSWQTSKSFALVLHAMTKNLIPIPTAHGDDAIRAEGVTQLLQISISAAQHEGQLGVTWLAKPCPLQHVNCKVASALQALFSPMVMSCHVTTSRC